ncbi:MAG: methionine--tRNA ligase [Chloroflexota bacterium]
MAEHVFIGVAWPYANGPLHLGHIAGAYLPADIFARYHRLKGNQVLMVSGSDQHGTPIMLRAEQEGKTPEEVVRLYHGQFLQCWQKLGISFDHFTTTGTENHRSVVHDMFLRLLEAGHLYRSSMQQAWCPTCHRSVPDRYLKGTCPYCGFLDSRGDQCDKCGRPLNADQLLDMRCRICGSPPRFEPSEHFFLRLSAFQEQLKTWISGQTHWRPNVLNFSLGYLTEGLNDRAITRDISWGVSVPQAGFESKRIYVWFEAVIGYLSASKEWARTQGRPDAWQSFWQTGAKSFYFIGKDNIPFHTLIWPAMLMGYGGLNLPHDVPANEFLTIEGSKLSTSRNWAVWLPDYLARYDPDPLRYLLSINMPDTSDTDFSWREFFRRNNNELVATYGNLAHRVLTFIQRNHGAAVPVPGNLDARSQETIARAEKTLAEVDNLLAGCHFKEAIKQAMTLAQEANRYLDDKAPWKAPQKEQQASSLYTALVVLSALKTMLHPFLPFSSEKLHRLLGFDKDVQSQGWTLRRPQPGTELPPPAPLFVKLDDKLAVEETERMTS